MSVLHRMSGRWRVGRSIGRTIYIMIGDEPAKGDTVIGDEPAKGDTVIGMMDTPELAKLVVDAVNAYQDTTGSKE